jgi:hypothetical protein
VGQQPPCTPATHDVEEDGVEDLAQGVHPRASGERRGREVGLDVGPFGIGEVGLVCSSHARYFTELLPQDPFSDSFKAKLAKDPAPPRWVLREARKRAH